MSTAKTIPPPEPPPEEGVTPIPNTIFRRGLTFDAIGLYATIVSLYQPREAFYQADLIRFPTGDGEYVIRSALRELRDAGLVRYRGRTGGRPGYWHEEPAPTPAENAATNAQRRP